MISNIFIRLRNLIYQTLYGFDTLLNRKADIIILCYHSIERDNWRYSISQDEFTLQMTYLQKNFNFISIEDLYLYLSAKKRISKPAVVITFDDGYKNLLSVRPIIKKLGVKPAFFILSDSKQANRDELGSDMEFLNKSEVNLLCREGWIVGCHSATHPDFWRLKEGEISAEIKDSKKTLERNLKCSVDFFAYPKGRYTPRVLETVEKARYRLAFSMDDAKIEPGSYPFTLSRIGVDKTHGFSQFKATISPSVIRFRSLVKKTPLFRFI